MRGHIKVTLAAFAVCVLAACAQPQGRTVSLENGSASAPVEGVKTQAALKKTEANIAALDQALRALSPGIDPQEAARAARIAYEYTAKLKRDYQIEDGPILHNIKVNNGTKPRGLCWHWAEDLEKRLGAEGFATLDLHRAIANFDNWRLEHSTVILSAKGADMYDGMVLDPWRKGGVLFWEKVRQDTRYNWTPRQEVFDWKKERGLLTVRYVTAAGTPVAR